MAISNRQKAILHIYKAAAALSEPTYRNYLRTYGGVQSSADPRLSQSGFDSIMAALETILWQRVDLGSVPDPRARGRKIASTHYWRSRCPDNGLINNRQLHCIEQLWSQLTEFLPDEQCSDVYLRGIARKATGQEVGSLFILAHKSAGLLIEALKDRLAWSIRSANPEAAHVPAS